VVTVDGIAYHVDLLDPRLPLVLGEIAGSDSQTALLRMLRAGDTFLDVGANHGIFALKAAKRVMPRGRVFAFEPQPRLAELIRRSSASLGPRFTVHQLALSDREGEQELHVPREGSGAASLFEEDGTALPVQTARLDVVLQHDLPGQVVIKLDVEGSELPFLEGAVATIRRYRPTIMFEFSPHTLESAGYEPVELINRLRGLGYRVTEIDRTPMRELSRDRDLLALPSHD
jgi:FkbM family methyltransferase